MKKKLLFVINSLGCGGAEKSLVSLLSVLDYEAYDAYLQMFNPGGMFLDLLPEKVNVLPRLPYFDYCDKGGFNPRFFAAKTATSIALRLRPRVGGRPLHDAQIFWKHAGGAIDADPVQYDAAIAWGQGNPTHYVAEKVSARRKIAFINADYEAVGHNKFFDKRFYLKYDYIATVSDVLKEKIASVFPEYKEKIKAVYDIRNQDLIEKMALEIDPFGIPHKVPVLVTVGRMVASKGYDLAVCAAAELTKRGLPFLWYFVGDGPESGSIRSAISENGLSESVRLVGAVSNPYPYIKNADIYVQTSRNEGFCLTLCEARGLGVPPVSTDFDAVYDQLRDGENGLIVNKTPEAIADGIERLMNDRVLYLRISEELKNEPIGNEKEIEKLYEMIG